MDTYWAPKADARNWIFLTKIGPTKGADAEQESLTLGLDNDVGQVKPDLTPRDRSRLQSRTRDGAGRGIEPSRGQGILGAKKRVGASL